LFNVYKTVGRF